MVDEGSVGRPPSGQMDLAVAARVYMPFSRHMDLDLALRKNVQGQTGPLLPTCHQVPVETDKPLPVRRWPSSCGPHLRGKWIQTWQQAVSR